MVGVPNLNINSPKMKMKKMLYEDEQFSKYYKRQTKQAIL